MQIYFSSLRQFVLLERGKRGSDRQNAGFLEPSAQNTGILKLNLVADTASGTVFAKQSSIGCLCVAFFFIVKLVSQREPPISKF